MSGKKQNYPGVLTREDRDFLTVALTRERWATERRLKDAPKPGRKLIWRTVCQTW